MSRRDLEAETLIELPIRLETAAWFSPVTVSTTQNALALNAINLGGSQTALAGNVALTHIEVG
jgi:hypothetical protein